MDKLGRLRDYEALYNLRYKYYPTAGGAYKLAEVMQCSDYIFNPDGVEKSFPDWAGSHEVTKMPPGESLKRSKSRARSKMFDILMSNDWAFFVTLTLDGQKIKRDDYAAVVKKLNTFLDNRVRRNGLKYLGVAELHKKGGIHFHFVTNDVLKIRASGTYIRPSGGKPVKADTIKRQGLKLEQCRTVYNVVDWSLGFSTALEVYGDRAALAAYLGKYITKAENKIGGRWYYSGGDLLYPKFEYDRVFEEMESPDYTFETPNGKFSVRRFSEKNSS